MPVVAVMAMMPVMTMVAMVTVMAVMPEKCHEIPPIQLGQRGGFIGLAEPEKWFDAR